MFPASTRALGVCFAFPDVCLVPAPPAPPIPVPFPNVGQLPMALPPTCTTRVRIQNMAVLHRNSEIPMSSGDEAGVSGGVASGTIMQKVAFRTGSTTVKVEGQQTAMLLAATAHNGASANAPVGAQVVPSQSVVLVGL